MISLKNVSYSYGKHTIIDKLSLSLPQNQITTIIGPNGAGKSTLLKLLSGAVKPDSGQLMIDGLASSRLTAKQIAQKIAVLHQENQLFDEMTVEQLLSLGKLPYANILNEPKIKIDADIVELLQLQQLEKKPMNQLSGGQKQRVWLGLALNQATPYLFLDEPTTYLDLHFQQELGQILTKLVKQKPLTICLVLHDLNQALRISDYCYLLDQGQIIKRGKPEEVLTSTNIQKTFGINCEILQTAHGPYLIEY